MFMKTTGNGLTLTALSTGGASLVRVAATIVAAFGSASEEKGGASASAGALISNQSGGGCASLRPSTRAAQPCRRATIEPNQLAKLQFSLVVVRVCLSRRSTRRERQGLRWRKPSNREST